MRILQIVLNYFTNDTRVLRAASLGLDMGCEVRVYALHQDGLPESEQIGGVCVQRFKLTTKKLPKNKVIQTIKFAEMLARTIIAGLGYKPTLVHANDFNALPIGYTIAKLTGASLIYDSHEMWCDKEYFLSRYPIWLFMISIVMERALARRADAVITVSEGIADRMAKNLSIERPSVVRNIPPKHLPPDVGANTGGPLRESLGIPPDTPIILYQGGIARYRGLSVLVNAMKHLSHPKAVLVFMGDGILTPELGAQAKEACLEDRVFFHPAVPPTELHTWTRDATVGIHPMEDVSLNHRLALPNKIFEYIHAGIPVVVTNLPEMGRVVREYGIGETFIAGDARDLAAKIDRILLDDAVQQQYRAAARMAAEELNWNTEQAKLRAIYQRLLTPHARRASQR